MAIGTQALGFRIVDRSMASPPRQLCIIKYSVVQCRTPEGSPSGPSPTLQPVLDQEVDVVGVRIGGAFRGVMRGDLSPVMVSVGQELVKDVSHRGVVLFAARSPEVDDVAQARRRQLPEPPPVLVEPAKELRLLQDGKR